jgi:hypothetical protein
MGEPGVEDPHGRLDNLSLIFQYVFYQIQAVFPQDPIEMRQISQQRKQSLVSQTIVGGFSVNLF